MHEIDMDLEDTTIQDHQEVMETELNEAVTHRDHTDHVQLHETAGEPQGILQVAKEVRKVAEKVNILRARTIRKVKVKVLATLVKARHTLVTKVKVKAKVKVRTAIQEKVAKAKDAGGRETIPDTPHPPLPNQAKLKMKPIPRMKQQ